MQNLLGSLTCTAFLLAAFSALPAGLLSAAGEFHPGAPWLDTSGNPIQAHGGGVLAHSNVFYWYGEDRTPGGSGAVACYSSTNLYDWKREGVALARAELPRVNERRTFVERPKVLFNSHSGKFVMWMHLEQSGYRFSRAGIALSDQAAGPFEFLKAIRPVAETNGFPANDPAAQDRLGGTVRDMNLFLDDDGRAYAFYSSEGNWTMYVVRLNQDFTGPELPCVEGKTWARILVRQMREGPAPFKFNGRYYLITSACTGWKPNMADCSVADNILGPYKSLGNPCAGPDADTTFGSQSTCVVAVPGQPGKLTFMADQWRPRELSDSRYVWLPLEWQTNGTFTLNWREHWSLGDANRGP